jgi:hypothetical protein
VRWERELGPNGHHGSEALLRFRRVLLEGLLEDGGFGSRQEM